MNQNFLDAAKKGQNNWWRYLLGVFLIVFSYWYIGSFASGILATILFLVSSAANGNEVSNLPSEFQNQLELYLQASQTRYFVIYSIPVLCAWLGIFVTINSLHKRQIKTLISADSSFKFQRLISGFLVWLIILIAFTGVDYLIQPQAYSWTFDLAQWLPLFPLVLVLTPIQTSAEEFLYRGYLLQGLGLLSRQRLVLILVTSLLFTLPHLSNPEMQRGEIWVALQYFSWGVFFSALTLKDNRLELSLGVHAANNIFAFLFVNTKDSVIPTPAVLTINDAGDPRLGLVVFWAMIAIFYYFFFGRGKQHSN
ncbi:MULTISPECIES: CPBP family intramembrane glutamic endopeptidase [Nostoc]|uniref:CPBP family intramembrane metalloprotease n=1 Tax=Nostoc paludosum FACHB-159 TaxID=2692908 RepID=A0ABR8K2R9_9NOSO|nr:MULTISPECIES: CPBP family intramembrane glutamic endopeptidase [Nostoc]MBD2677142.1 CPBP family intramembrane metalloprotease [Nostoc sp. FACHB-857]MBD2733049.1 CPBP family intramembrane metalloprotease [Nostoc paludosum FACHB-159]